MDCLWQHAHDTWKHARLVGWRAGLQAVKGRLAFRVIDAREDLRATLGDHARQRQRPRRPQAVKSRHLHSTYYSPNTFPKLDFCLFCFRASRNVHASHPVPPFGSDLSPSSYLFIHLVISMQVLLMMLAVSGFGASLLCCSLLTFFRMQHMCIKWQCLP